MFNPYLIGGAVVAVGLIVGGTYIKGRADGRESVLQKLQNDRITVFQDGVKIDNEVIGADDNALCDLLGGCS